MGGRSVVIVVWMGGFWWVVGFVVVVGRVEFWAWWLLVLRWLLVVIGFWV